MDFISVHNYHEQAVFRAVSPAAPDHPGLQGDADLLADVACVALNRLPPRYVRHDVDMVFFLTEHERAEQERALAAAIDYAFSFVQSRQAMRARA